jgi:ABC-type transporter MlaC component
MKALSTLKMQKKSLKYDQKIKNTCTDKLIIPIFEKKMLLK